VSETFCPTCQEYRETRIEARDETYTVRGRTVTVNVEVEVCPTCGQTVFQEDRDAGVMRRVYDAYRREEGLLTPDEIKAIRKQYALSQRSFAALLGMSQATINRYERGAVQERAHDEAIRACRSPDHVLGLLDRRGNSLSEWQRRRAESVLADSVTELGPGTADLNRVWDGPTISMPSDISIHTGYRRFSYARCAAVVAWLCKRLDAIPKTMVNKLLFYVDFLHFKRTTMSLTGCPYRRIQHGPVPADYGALFSQMEWDGYIEVEEKAYGDGVTGDVFHVGTRASDLRHEFTPHELAVLEFVARHFQGWTAKRIRDYSHRESAFTNTPDRGLISYDQAMDLSLSIPE